MAGATGVGARTTRTRLDRAVVVEAARELLDEHGFDRFSMSRLGDRLGVTAMALYRHVADRADLEQAVAELVLGDLTVDPGPDDDWAAGVAIWMYRVRDHWRHHPWLGRLLGDRTQLTPPWLAALDRLAHALERAGLPVDEIAREVVRISRATAGTVVLEIAAPLPHAAWFGTRMLGAAPPEVDQQRWRSMVEHLNGYSDDDLFADLVADTMARLRATRQKERGNG